VPPKSATPAEQPRAAPVYAYTLGDALYLNITSACTLACVFCPKISEGDWVVGGYDLKLARAPSADEVWRAVLAAGLDGRSEVVFTGLGEPTRRFSELLELVRRLRAAGVRRVRLDTDGLASLRERRDVVPELVSAGLCAASVSLNAADAATYAKLCPSAHGEAAFAAVCDFIARAAPALQETTATVVGVPGLDVEACRRLAEGLGARFRLRPYGRLGRLRKAASAG
jgi:cyclic pyranopterin phosphate synthase